MISTVVLLCTILVCCYLDSCRPHFIWKTRHTHTHTIRTQTHAHTQIHTTHTQIHTHTRTHTHAHTGTHTHTTDQRYSHTARADQDPSYHIGDIPAGVPIRFSQADDDKADTTVTQLSRCRTLDLRDQDLKADRDLHLDDSGGSVMTSRRTVTVTTAFVIFETLTLTPQNRFGAQFWLLCTKRTHLR